MAQSIITLAFETYKAQQEAIAAPIALDEFVLANIPNQDPNAPIDRNEMLPSQEHIVFVADVTQDGFVNPNAVVYSLIMDTRVGDFEFNWVGLRAKESGVLAAILHIPTITKFQSIAGVQNGNSVTRSILMSYQDAQNATGISVDASTWQIDFTARLFGIDEAERQSNIDVFGHVAFLVEGFLVQKVGDDYIAKAGCGYVGGLRCHLDSDLTLGNVKSSTHIYVDASWQGQLTSQWHTEFEIVVSTGALTDYVDTQGYQHYVTKIAEVDAVGNITDLRILEGFSEYYQRGEVDDKLHKKIDKSSITDSTNSTSSVLVASAKAINSVKTIANSKWSYVTATISRYGAVILSNAYNGISQTKATTEKALSDGLKTKSNAVHTHSATDINAGTLAKERLPNASTSAKGAVQLTDSTSSTSSVLSATAKAVKAAYDLAASKMTQASADGRYLGKAAKAADSDKLDGYHASSFMRSFILEDGDGTERSIAHGKEVKFVEGTNIDINWTDTSTGSDADPYDLTFTVPNASTSKRGAVQLTDSTSSTSSTLAATAKALKAAYDLAASKMTQASADGRYLGKTAKAADSAKLNGVSESTSPIANKIVKRGGSGDVEARLFRSTYANQTSAPSASAAIVFRNDNAGDNYHRAMTKAAMKAWLTLTKSDIGLSQVPNYQFTTSVGDSSTTKFAAASAVRTAYNLAASKMTQASADGRYWKRTEQVAKAKWADSVDVNTSGSTSFFNVLWHSGDTVYGSNGKVTIRPSDGYMKFAQGADFNGTLQAPLIRVDNDTDTYMNSSGVFDDGKRVYSANNPPPKQEASVYSGKNSDYTNYPVGTNLTGNMVGITYTQASLNNHITLGLSGYSQHVLWTTTNYSSVRLTLLGTWALRGRTGTVNNGATGLYQRVA